MPAIINSNGCMTVTRRPHGSGTSQVKATGPSVLLVVRFARSFGFCLEAFCLCLGRAFLLTDGRLLLCGKPRLGLWLGTWLRFGLRFGVGIRTILCASLFSFGLALGFIGLAWETVLPDSGPHKRDISANNVLFTLIPTANLSRVY